jgi:uncharacterized protein YjbI with pentapeptide repeats
VFDWLDLLAKFLIPVVIAGAGFLFSERQDQTARSVQISQAQDTLLNTYFDRMSDLLIAAKLRNVAVDAPEQVVAEARTLTALQRLDGTGKGDLLRFLYEAQLLYPTHSALGLGFRRGLVYLGGSDLSGTNLGTLTVSGADFGDTILSLADFHHSQLVGTKFDSTILERANFSGANLNAADLNHATLTNANLTNADLTHAKLVEADLRGADLTGANLAYASLKGAFVTSAQLAAAKSLRHTMLPDATLHP